jgi:hypothetical protein
VFLNKFLTTALLATVGFSISSYSQQENCPCPVRETNQGQSLADAAKDAKKNKTAHAAKAITDEDMDSERGPFPSLNMDGTDNSDEIIQAIGDFKAKHNEREIEQALHDWYDEYDTILATAIRETHELQDQRESTSYHGYEICQQGGSYQQCLQRRQTEIRGARHDQSVMRDNGMVTARVQQAFIKIRGGIGQFGLHYSWFKVRNANGNGSF